jgi:hypothetical protein
MPLIGLFSIIAFPALRFIMERIKPEGSQPR